MANISFHRKPTEFAPARKSWGSTFEIGLFIVLAVLAYIYLINPKQKEYSDRENQLVKLADDERRVQSQKQAYDRLVKKLRDNPDLVQELDQMMPLESRISSVYVLIEYFTQAAGMTSSSISVDSLAGAIAAGDKPTLADKFGTTRELITIPVAVNAIGNMDQLSNFLAQVENSNRLLDVLEVNIGQGRDQQFIFKILLNAYAFAPKPQEDASVPAAAPAADTSPQ